MPQLAAGHSLGEYSALVANQTLSLEDCLNLVTERAKFMVDAMTGVQGGMAAIMSNNTEMNLSETVEKVCEQLSNDKEIIQPVNYNSKNQIVIAGH
jgi:[acyl-carrier-protein] S-malonyltransferase